MSDKLELKKKIYNTCLAILEENAETARQTMNQIQQDANEAEQEHDVFDGSRSELLRERDIYAEQLQKAVDEIQILKKVSFESLVDQVEFGAVVITNRQKMFIVLGLGKVEVDGDTYFVISKDVPIYKAMEGLKAGDRFTFNEMEFEIKDIF
jgi:transcription elongation GreA/GreB family factor